MSLSRVTFTKDWKNPSDFPTIETSEAQVRADIQDLHDQLREAINLVIGELESTLEISGASQIGLNSVTGLPATNVQSAIAALKALVDNTGTTAGENLASHTQNKENPHAVKASQVPLSVIGINANRVDAALSELKALLDLKAAASSLADYETLADAKQHFMDVSLNASTGVLTFTRQDGSVKSIDTALEEIPVSMKFFEKTEGGRKVYYLGIYDAEDKLISSVNVSALFNEIEISSTATITMSQSVDAQGVKTIACAVKDGSIGETQFTTAFRQRVQTIEDLLNSAVTGKEDSAQIALSLSEGTNGKTLKAEIKANSIGEDQISQEYTANMNSQKEAAEAAAANAKASEDNANDYQSKAKSYAVGDEAARPGSSTDNALYYKGKASEEAVKAKSYSQGGTNIRPGEDTDNAKYYKEQAALSKQSAAASSEAAAEKAAVAASQAVLSKSYAQGGTGSRVGEDENNAKYYMEQAANIVAGAGLGDMLKSIYDPRNKSQDVFKYVEDKAAEKVDKVTGKQLSTEDYTNADKGKVNNLPENTAAALNGKIGKVAPAAAGNLPTLTADGQLADSGKKLDDLGGDGAFIAVYNSTTYEEIKEAYESSTPVICFYNANLTAGGKVEYRLHALTDETAIFVGMESAYSDLTVDFLLCSSSSEWTVDYAHLLPEAHASHKGYILAVNDAGNWQITDPPFAAKPTVITGTLSAGSTTLTLQNAAITINSVYDIYTDKWGVNPTDVVVTAGKITMTFEKQNASIGVRVEVR